MQVSLANEQLGAWHSPFIDIYKIVKDDRNDALHQGALHAI
jgi:hypothetical protein